VGLNLVFLKDVTVIVIDKNSKYVFERLKGFGKGKDCTSKSPNSVSQAGSPSFHVIGLPFLLTAVVMAI
jgi:hypothetical protein